MLIIGERINCTRKPIARAVTNGDEAFIQQVALQQVRAGAAMLDVNGGIAGHEVEYLPWLVDVIQKVVDITLCLDSPDPEALGRALPLCRYRPMINSITDDPVRFSALAPLAQAYGARVIALCLSESGYPTTADDRIKIAASLIRRLTAAGIPPQDIYVDPAVFPVSTNTEYGNAVLDTIETVVKTYPDVHTICGLSNVSFGLPARMLLNQTFLVLAMGRGVDTVIADPCDSQLMANLAAAEMLLGRDEFCAAYLQAHQSGRLEPEKAVVSGQ
ncbi:MAG: dihydropteroate synthase [Candidatus Latescibacteria bacterium]|nr:dihydropteroate synthase [Candidatus Latescibacterota bacterium]